jgi:hypothetical protein
MDEIQSPCDALTADMIREEYLDILIGKPTSQKYVVVFSTYGARGSVIGSGTMVRAGRSRDRVPMRWIFFNLPYPSSRTVALGSTEPLAEMSTRNLPGVKDGRRVGLTTLPSVSRMSRQDVGASTSHKPMGLHGLLQG